MSGNGFKNLPSEMLPRARMRMAACISDVPSETLLAIILKTGAPGCDVLELSRRLIAAFGGVRNLVSNDWRSLEAGITEYNSKHPERSIRGIGKVKSLELAAAFELVRRECRVPYESFKQKVIRTTEDVYDIFKAFVDASSSIEKLYVLPVDAKYHPLSEPILISSGSESDVSAPVREVFRLAIKWSAPNIVVAHNHPSGDSTPSHADIRLTIQLRDAAEVLGLHLIDHLVLVKEGFRSIIQILESNT